MSANTYNKQELIDMVNRKTAAPCNEPPEICYIVECEMWQYYVKEVYLSGFGGSSSDDLIFLFTEDGEHDIEIYPGEAFKTREAAQADADIKQAEIENRLGGKDKLNEAIQWTRETMGREQDE